MKYLVTLSRILVGVLFILSGFIKANDTLGFSYKLDEYFLVFNMPFLSTFSLAMAQFICVAEIVLGVATLVGWRMNLVSWLLLLMIVFFTFLTFYSAWFNVVKDCGCFGDALKLKPWESFWKDVILLVLILIIFVWRHKIRPLLGIKFTRWTVIIALLISSVFTYYTYAHLPYIDFRPYAIGNNIKIGMLPPPNARPDSIVIVFKYKAPDGSIKEFGMNNLPEDLENYQFVDRIDKVVREGDKPKIHDFKIVDADGNDHTQEFLNNPEYSFMLVAYDLNKTNKKVQGKINELANACTKNKIQFFGLTSTLASETDLFRHEHQNMFDYYFCDATTLKTIIRSNPGLVLLQNGVVINMWHFNDLPTWQQVNDQYLKK
jgi:uncharacterized membrane protein YphA (DoxX/SURF4 family)/uncharacterized protein YnzC (UPF0291/DUF896 family)